MSIYLLHYTVDLCGGKHKDSQAPFLDELKKIINVIVFCLLFVCTAAINVLNNDEDAHAFTAKLVRYNS